MQTATEGSKQQMEEMELLRIRLGAEGQGVDLGDLELMAEQLRATYRELIRDAGGDQHARVNFKIINVANGSVVFDLQPQIKDEEAPEVNELTRTLIGDINRLGEGKPRPTMSSNLLRHYDALFAVSVRAGRLELGFGKLAAVMDQSNRIDFQSATKNSVVPETRMVGLIETINIHRRPWKFGLYTKLDRQRIECRFTDNLLATVTRLMEGNALVEVCGEATFGPVGITPVTIELTEEPVELDFSPNDFLRYAHSSAICLPGETATSALERIRAEATPRA